MLKGCCAGLLQGLVIVLGILAIFSSIAMSGLGFSLALNFNAKILGYSMLGWGIGVTGLMMMAAVGVAVMGSWRESRRWVKIAAWTSGIVLIPLLLCLLLLMIDAGSLMESARDSWFALSPDHQQSIEDKLSCCGYEDVRESRSPQGCPYLQPCSKPLTGRLENLLKTARIAVSAAMLLYVPVVLVMFFLLLCAKEDGAESKGRAHIALTEQIRKEKNARKSVDHTGLSHYRKHDPK